MSRYYFLVAILSLLALAGVAYKYRSPDWKGIVHPRSDISQVTTKRSSSADILNYSGYEAENYYVSTPDGYRLNVVRARNPLIKSKELHDKQPVIFLHGKRSCSEIFVIRLKDAKPRDLSRVNMSFLDESQKLNKALDPDNPSSQTAVSLLLDLGHEVWLLDRRGAPGSLESQQDYTLGDNSLDELDKYWDFSLDEQVRYDLPEVINYVRYVTNKPKVSLVGHSIGGAIILMTLAKYPEIADKVETVSLWSPTLYLGYNDGQNPISSTNDMFTYMNYNGPSPPVDYYPQKLSIDEHYCANVNNPICRSSFGDKDGQMELRTEYTTTRGLPDSSRTLAQRLQSAVKGAMHHYDYYDPDQNLQAYGQRSPPLYNVSQIQSKLMYIWRGKSDQILSKDDVLVTLRKLTVPTKYKEINSEPFYHLSYFFQRNLASVFLFPAVRALLK